MTPYTNNELFAFFFKDATSSEGLLRRIAESLSAASSYRVWDRWLSPRRNIGILNVTLHEPPPPPVPPSFLQRMLAAGSSSSGLATNRLRAQPGMAVLQAGYTTTKLGRWDRSIRREGSTLRCEDAGGIAAFAVARFDDTADEQLYLWSTRPGLRSIAYAETHEFVVAGTRPFWVHRIARSFADKSLDHDYVRASLCGWSLGDRTPYQGTSLISVDAMLCVDRGQCSWHGHPTPDYARRDDTRLEEEAGRYRRALRGAVEPLRTLPAFELRLSGGKDSRLVAAALYERGVVPSTVICHGMPGAWEVPVAERVAQALGWTLKLAVPEFASQGGVLETVRHNLTLTDGFLATEPLQAVYPAYGISGDPGQFLVLGHIELQRGGWAKAMRGTHRGIINLAQRRLTPLHDCVVPALPQAIYGILADYMQQLKVTSEAEYLYWVNYRFRVCRWLTSHYLQHSKELLPVYPLVDEKVVRVVANAPLRCLVSEQLAFATTSGMAPQLGEMPLFRERYRFEENKPSQRFTRGYEARAPMLPGPSIYDKRELRLPPEVVGPLCEHVRGGKLREELREVTADSVWAVIEDPTPQRMQDTKIDRKTLASYLWICFQASVLFGEGLQT